MNNKNNGYYSLITGASSGIGKAFAYECAKLGMNLFLVALPNTKLLEISEEISREHNVSVKSLEIDLAEDEAHYAVLNFLKENNLRLNMLINNVGVGHNGNLDTMSEIKISNMLLLNIRTTTLLTQILLPELRNNHQSYILNISSMAAFSPLPGKCMYSATKAYVLYFSRALREEVKKDNISVSCVVPAGVPTNQKVINRIKNSGWVSKKITQSPERVAHLSIKGLLKKKAIIFPGKRLKAFFWMAGLIPQGLVIALTKREFRNSKE